MAQNEPRRKETPPGSSPNSPSLLFEYQCRSGKFIRLANRIEKIDSVEKIESNIFLPELECSSTWYQNQPWYEQSSSSSDNGADSIPSNIAPRVNKQVCVEKAVQQTMKSNFG